MAARAKIPRRRRKPHGRHAARTISRGSGDIASPTEIDALPVLLAPARHYQPRPPPPEEPPATETPPAPDVIDGDAVEVQRPTPRLAAICARFGLAFIVLYGIQALVDWHSDPPPGRMIAIGIGLVLAAQAMIALSDLRQRHRARKKLSRERTPARSTDRTHGAPAR